MKFVWMVVVHFSMYMHDIPVVPFQAKGVYTSQQACNVARATEDAYWASISYPKPVSIVCEAIPVRR